MGSKIDLLNKTFGRLNVIEVVESTRDSSNRSLVLRKCLCVCGNTVIVKSLNLLSNQTKSCGCLQKESAKRQGHKNYKGLNVAAINSLYSRLKKVSKYREIVFELDKEIYASLIFKPCDYCGRPPQGIYRKGSISQTFYNGLDRIDSNKGYLPSNVVPCCGDCNMAKSDLTKEQFLSLIKTIYQRQYV